MPPDAFTARAAACIPLTTAMLATPAPVDRLPTTRTLNGTLLVVVAGVADELHATKRIAMAARPILLWIPDITDSSSSVCAAGAGGPGRASPEVRAILA